MTQERRVSYSKKVRARAKEKGTALVTVDTRNSKGKMRMQLQSNCLTAEQLSWFDAFCIHWIAMGKSPQEAWDCSFGGPNCPVHMSQKGWADDEEPREDNLASGGDCNDST